MDIVGGDLDRYIKYAWSSGGSDVLLLADSRPLVRKPNRPIYYRRAARIEHRPERA